MENRVGGEWYQTKKWKSRNARKMSGKMPQFMESRMAGGEFNQEDREQFFDTHVTEAFEHVGYEPPRS